MNSGVNTDFTVVWYKDVGDILINNMIFNIGWPLIEFFMFYFMRLGYRLLDRGFSFKSDSTKCTRVTDYIALYRGPEYVIHYKYSFILNIVFITFMFGAGMPILFPIACFSFAVLYVMERLQLAYSYQKPPMFDDSLNEAAINILITAPILYCTVGFWMFNNLQIFWNDVVFNQSFNEHMHTGHTFTSIFNHGLDHSTPLFILFLVAVVAYLCRYWWFQLARDYIGLSQIEKLKTKTESVTFYEALHTSQRKWIKKQEEDLRAILGGVTKIDDITLQKLNDKRLKGHDFARV